MRSTSFLSGFLPQSLAQYIRRRAYQICASFTAIVGLLLLFSLLSYHSADPSWNTATGTVFIENLLGATGAALADILLQAFGLGAFMPVLVCFGLAALLWNCQPIDQPLERLLAAILGCFTVAVAAAPWHSVPLFWSWPVGIGGGIGTMLYDVIADSGGAAWRYTGYGVSVLFAGLSLYLLHQAGSWRWRGTFRAAALLLQHAWQILERGVEWLLARDWGALTAFRPRLKQRETSNDIDDVFFGGSGEPIDVSTLPELVERPAARKAVKAKEPKKAAVSQKSSSIPDKTVALLPPLTLLNAERSKSGGVDAKTLKARAEQLALVLNDYGVSGKIIEARPGPVVTLYELEPAAGIKSSRIISLADDIARSMSALSARVAVVPGRNVIGIE
ncbi:MAG: DNA translocase FtsK 4TM domain-containing protein, partial [Thalassospira sp.]|nr:DNA translocase FtsK 4TM domain-containing protein [Thalassospira sp.]